MSKIQSYFVKKYGKLNSRLYAFSIKIVILTFNSNVFSALLSTFVLTYIIIFVNFRKESKNDMDILYVKKPTNGHVGKRKEQDYE